MRIRLAWLLSCFALQCLGHQRDVPQKQNLEINHVFEKGDPVIVWTDRMGPYDNPHETYPFDFLLRCRDEGIRKEATLGEALAGHDLISFSRVQVLFAEPMELEEICTLNFSSTQIGDLVAMAEQNYWFQWYVDDLPLWGFIGERGRDESDGKIYIYTHRHFLFTYNGNQIISVDLMQSAVQELRLDVEEDTSLKFTYSVEWKPSEVTFRRRFDRYLESSFFEHKVHWFSIVNSLMLCLFLCVVVSVILMRTLSRDFAIYAASDLEELESMDRVDQRGWKQVSGDVFRRPRFLVVFAALFGSGFHVAAVILIVAVLALFNSYYAYRGTTAGAVLLAYVFTQFVNGYSGGYIFKCFGGNRWKRALVSQLLLLPFVISINFWVFKTTALIYSSSIALPVRGVLTVVALFLVVCFPLHIIGVLIGRRVADRCAMHPCRVNHLRRPIPKKHDWILPSIAALSGLVQFGCVFIELYFIFSSFWGYKFYYVYGFMLAIALLFSCVVVCVSITCTYVLLNFEDYRWVWMSFLSCGSTGLYVFLYSVYYYWHSTKMRGTLQFLYFFGSSMLFSFCMFLFCGALGSFGAYNFVRLIYKNVKSD